MTAPWGSESDVSHSIAVVTGASAGVGRAIAEAFAALGWTVAVGARRVDRLEETAEAIRTAGGTPFAHRLDVTDADSVEAFFAALEAEVGVADVLVNNAGLGYLGAVAETTPERLETVVETNLLGALLCTRRFLSALLTHQVDHDADGDVVFISSDSVHKPVPHMITYGATKVAVEYLASGLDVELTGTGIRVSTVRLGPTVSEFNTAWPVEDMVAFMETYERLGIKEDFNYIPVEHVALAVVNAVTAPRGTKISLLSVRPESTRSQDERERWRTAATQGRAKTQDGPEGDT
ncbi:MAG: SDR family NAD(P)-dependent oxidoreductase [Acidimicrobiales bacterium]|jgi:NADP-dependent 3-hydroxy acid dehydrogenase YdfG|nr:SDR family NAD(P)-dependent oxidoreductase [Acidimicrobiales bacterium]